MKETIRNFVIELGVDDVGFAAVSAYSSPRSPKIQDIFPDARTIIVMAVREMSHCESSNPRIAMSGRLDLMEFGRHCNFKLTRFLEKKYSSKAMGVPISYPLEMNPDTTKGTVADVSLRHAAIAAGLGYFGRNNLVLHPRFGSRVIFFAVLSNLDITPDKPFVNDICTHCNLCVEACPSNALNQEGLTDINKCLKVSQPYGLGKAIAFWSKYGSSNPEEQKKMLFSRDFWEMYHAQSMGFQYYCFNCYSVCPLGNSN